MSKLTTYATIQVDGLSIDFYSDKDGIGYYITYKGLPYGTKLNLPSRKLEDIIAVVGLLISNALSVKKELDYKNEN